MATTTITGNLAGDPTLRHTASGRAVANFRVGESRRRFDAATQTWIDLPTLWLSVTVWGDAATNFAASAKRGQRVTITGDLVPTEYTKDDGTVVRGIELSADDCALSTRFAAASVAASAPADARALADTPY